MTGVLFGATVLAAATSLPELSTGLTAVRLGDYRLAISDIFGGNAFLPVLFLMATLISGQSALPQLQNTDLYLAGLGVLLTCVYLYGLIFRSKAKLLGMGIDSLLVLILYVIGTAGLFAIAAEHPVAAKRKRRCPAELIGDRKPAWLLLVAATNVASPIGDAAWLER